MEHACPELVEEVEEVERATADHGYNFLPEKIVFSITSNKQKPPKGQKTPWRLFFPYLFKPSSMGYSRRLTPLNLLIIDSMKQGAGLSR